MGSLILPTSGVVYFDSVKLIYSVEMHSMYWKLLRPVWLGGQTGTVRMVSSELALMETLIGPFKSGNSTILASYEAIFRGTDLQPLPINEPILREAARLRATVSRLRTPNAIYAATSLVHGCAQFVTNDHGLRNVPGLPAVILSDLVP